MSTACIHMVQSNVPDDEHTQDTREDGMGLCGGQDGLGAEAAHGEQEQQDEQEQGHAQDEEDIQNDMDPLLLALLPYHKQV